MSQGDEYQAGEPPTPNRAWRDMNDAREEREDFGDLPKPPPQRSGLVMTVGILAIIFGSFGLMCGVCSGLCGGTMAGGSGFFQDFMKQAAAKDPNVAKDPNLAKAMKELEEKGKPIGYVTLGAGIYNTLMGLGLVLGGILVLRRSNIGRFLTLGMAVLIVLGMLVRIGVLVALGLFELQGAVYSGVGMVLGLAFTGFAFYALMFSKGAKEFAG